VKKLVRVEKRKRPQRHRAPHFQEPPNGRLTGKYYYLFTTNFINAQVDITASDRTYRTDPKVSHRKVSRGALSKVSKSQRYHRMNFTNMALKNWQTQYLTHIIVLNTRKESYEVSHHSLSSTFPNVLDPKRT